MHVFGCCPCWPKKQTNHPPLLGNDRKVRTITMPPKSVCLTIKSKRIFRENGVFEGLFQGTNHYTGFTKNVIKSNQWIITCDEEQSAPTCELGPQKIKVKDLFSDTIVTEVLIEVHAKNISNEQREIPGH